MFTALSSPRQRLVLVVLLVLVIGATPVVVRAEGPYVTPNTGNLITTFCLYASGFTAYEPVAMWLEFSSGSIQETVPSATVLTNASGNLGAQESDLYAGNGCFFDPGDGTWLNGQTRVTAQGLKSHHQASALFMYEGQAPASDGAGLHLSEQFYSPKDTPWFSFTGSGFNPNSRVSLWFSTPDGTVKIPSFGSETYADAGGVMHAQMYRGELRTAGDYLLVASDGVHEYSHRFTLIENEANSLQLPNGRELKVNPAAGPYETFFLIYGGGFNPYETVDGWFTLPDGTVLPFVIEADDRGIAEFAYQAFPGEPLGERTIHFRGRASKFQLDDKWTLLDAPYDP